MRHETRALQLMPEISSSLNLSRRQVSIPFFGGLHAHSYRFPGRWMSDDQLLELRSLLNTVTLECFSGLPGYGVFMLGRKSFSNRIITVFQEGSTGAPAGFSAMFVFTARVDGADHGVVHLGMTALSPRHRGQGLMFALYYVPLFIHWVLGRLATHWITSVSQEPAIIGSVADNFADVYPSYRAPCKPSSTHLEIARCLVSGHSHEFGMGPDGYLDEDTFVVRSSCRGPSEIVRCRSIHEASRYRTDAACGRFCGDRLDYSRGDELLQVGKSGYQIAWPTIARWLRLRRRGVGGDGVD